MEDYKLYRKNILDILELWSSKEQQLEYQRNVPIAQVSEELFCQWEDYFANGEDFDEFLSKREQELVNYFNKELHQIWNQLHAKFPTWLPEIELLVETDEWKILNKKAGKILQEIIK